MLIRDPWKGVRREEPLKNRQPLTLEDCVKAQRDLWAFCRHCGHAARVRTKTLVLKVDFIALEDAARSMRCVRCNSRQCMLIPDRKWPDRN